MPSSIERNLIESIYNYGVEQNLDAQTIKKLVRKFGTASQARKLVSREVIESDSEKELFSKTDQPTVSRIHDFILYNPQKTQKNITPVNELILTAPTQVGKTSYIISSIKKCEKEGFLFVVSCDNSKAQLTQFKNRLTKHMKGLVFDVKEKDTKAIGNLLEQKKSVVLIVLNNSAQIKKLSNMIYNIKYHSNNKKIVFFVDEGDVVNKSDDMVEIANDKTAITHRAWLNMFDLLCSYTWLTSITRFWVSATPENCSSLSGITGNRIITLPINEDYTPVSEHVDWSPSETSALSSEIERIREARNGEIILYCVEKTIKDQLVSAELISEKHNCTTITYNNEDVVCYSGGEIIQTTKENNADISAIIAGLRSHCLDSPLVVVGYKMMDRGISFVASSSKEDKFPPSATVMFYSGSKTTHVVGIAQRFGRITGTSRPDIKRRAVYCQTSTYTDYVSYIKNQQKIWDALDDSDNYKKTMAEILSDCEANPIKRPIDRPKLNKVNNEYAKIFREQASSSEEEEAYDDDKMRRLVKRWSKQSNSTKIARLFRDIIQGSYIPNNSELNEKFTPLIRNHKSGWNTVFATLDGKITIRQEAMGYYNSLNK